MTNPHAPAREGSGDPGGLRRLVGCFVKVRAYTSGPISGQAAPTQDVSMADAPSPASTRSRAALGALRPLVPFAFRYKGRIGAALGALVIASAATLVLPIAVRRVVDHGFSGGSGYLV